MQRQEILNARQGIVKAANKHKWKRHRNRPGLSVALLRHPRLFGPRQWQEALGVCRRFSLVDPDVISDALGKE